MEYYYFPAVNSSALTWVLLIQMKKEYADRFKFSIFDIGILLLISFASAVGNFHWKRIYWLAEMPVYIFVLALSVLGAVFLFLKGPEKIKWGVADYLLIFYFVYLVTRTFIAYYPGLPTDKIWIIIASCLFYFLIRVCRPGNIPSSYENIIRGIIYLAAFHAIIGMFQWIGLLPGYDNSRKIAGLFSNPGLQGCFMAIGACLSLDMVLNKESRSHKLINLFLFLLILTGLILSGSRTAWIAAFIPCTFIILRYFSKVKRRPVKAQVTVGIALALKIFVIAGFYLYNMNTDSVSGRMLIWEISWGMFKVHPVFGMGYGSYYTEYGNYQAEYFLSSARPQQEILSASMNYYAFSEPLTLLIEEGMIGAFLFTALAAYAVFRALRFNDNKFKNIKGAALSIITVLLIFGLFSYPFQDLFFVLLFIMSISIISGARSQPEVKGSLVPGKYWRAGIVVTLIMIGGYSAIKILAVYTWKAAKEKILVSEGDALASYNHAYDLLNNNGAFLFNYGSELAALGQYGHALKILQRATRYGNSVELHLQIGNVYQALGQLKDAERSLLRASAMNPKLFLPLSKLMLFYKENRQYEKCREIAKQIIHKPVKIPSETIENIKKLAASNIK